MKSFYKAYYVKAIWFVFLVLAITNTNAQHVVTDGYIYDSETNEPVYSAVITLLPLDKQTFTDQNGYFKFLSHENESPNSIKVFHIAYSEKFVPLKKNENLLVYLIPKSIEISTVVITDHTTTNVFDDVAEETQVLKGRELEKDLGLTLASTLKNETGLAMRSMGPAPARPVLRGLGGDRVLIKEDGIETTDLSASSPDHAVTIEPFGVERIEVLRGPRVITSSSSTIGGIVNVIKNEIPEKLHDSFFGQLGVYTETANKGLLGSFIAEMPINNVELRTEVSKRKTNDISTPIGTLKNSDSENLNYSFGGSYIDKFGYAGASFRNFNLDYGVPGGFLGGHPNGVNIQMKRQQGNIKARIDFHSKKLNHLHLNFSRVYYRHKEFESSGTIGSEFEITNYVADLKLDHKKVWLAREGVLGLSFKHRDFIPGGFVFTPPSKSTSFAAFLFEEIDAGKFHIEFGSRLDYNKHTPEYENSNSKIGNIRAREFLTYSLSTSIIYPVTKIVSIGLNINKSSRTPTLEELYSQGPHLAAYSYETGNPDLESESGIGTEFFVFHKYKNLFYNFNFFYNSFNNYIIPRNSGEIHWGTFLPIYTSVGVKAQMYGAEGQIKWRFFNNFSINTSYSFTKGVFSPSGKSLPQIPPLKGLLGLDYKTDNLLLGFNTTIAMEQNNVDQFEDPTAGYMIFNLFGQYSFIAGSYVHNISVSVDNLLDKEYRNHLSRIKSIFPEAGRNVRLTYKIYFHL